VIDNPTIALRNIERFAEMESKSRSTSMAQVSLRSPICGNCQARELKIDKMFRAESHQ
jgi:hypothetical protein